MRSHHQPDYFFIILVWLLTAAGLASLLSASLILGKNRFNDPFYYFKHQLIYGAAIGLLGFLVTSQIYYRKWKKWAVPLLLGTILLMILVFTPLGYELKEARRWLNIGFLSFQPSEILKLTFMIYLAAWLAKRGVKVKSLTEGLIPFLVFIGILSVLLLLQPSTGTLLVIFATSLVVYFLSGAKLWHIGLVLALIVAGLAALILVFPNYRIDRILSFLGYGDIQATGRDYHILQSLIAIGSGGITGVGFGNAVSKYSYLPEPMGDSIFAVIAQEFGFIGSLVLVSLYVLLFFRGIKISLNSPDVFSRLLSIGLISLVIVQTFINIGAMTRLIPMTGQPLPFVSYGGTNLVVFLTSMGVIVNISKHTRKQT